MPITDGSFLGSRWCMEPNSRNDDGSFNFDGTQVLDNYEDCSFDQDKGQYLRPKKGWFQAWWMATAWGSRYRLGKAKLGEIPWTLISSRSITLTLTPGSLNPKRLRHQYCATAQKNEPELPSSLSQCSLKL